MQEQISNFFNSPIGITLTSIVGFAIVAFVIFAKTSVGRKAIVKFGEGLAKALGYAKVASDSVKELKAEKEREIKELTEAYESKLGLVLSENLALEELIAKIGEAIPNKKVAQVIEEFGAGKEERLKLFQENLISYEEIEALKAEIEKAKAKADDAIAKAQEEAEAKLEAEKALFQAKREELERLLEELEKRAQEAVEGEMEHE